MSTSWDEYKKAHNMKASSATPQSVSASSWDEYKKKRRIAAGGLQPEDEAYNSWLDGLKSYSERAEREYKSRENKYQSESYLRRYSIDAAAHMAQLRTGAEQSWNYYTENRDLYDELYGNGTVDNILSAIAQGTKHLDDISKGLDSEREYWGQWDDGATYRLAMQAAEEQERLSKYDLSAAQAEIDSLTERKRAIESGTPAYMRTGALGAGGSNSTEETRDIDRQISELQRESNRATQVQKANEYKSYLQADDFARYSKLGAAVENPSAWDTQKGVSIFGWNPFAQEVKNKVKFAKENATQLALGASNGGSADEIGYLPYTYMTDDEESIYNYLLAKEGEKSADEYLDNIIETLNYRMGTQQATSIEDIDSGVLRGGAKALYGAGAGLDQWVSGTRQRFSKDALPTSPTQFGSAAIHESLSDDWAQLPEWMGGGSLAQAAYDAVTTTANMAPSILLSYFTGGLGAPAAVSSGVGAATLGASASGNAYNQARKDGYGEKEARNYAALIGASEAGLQYLLGGISALGGKVAGKSVSAAIKNIDSAFLRFAAETGLNMLGEGTEEYLQDILEPVFRNLCFNENNEFRIWTKEATYSFMLGAITAGMIEGPTSIANGVSVTQRGNAVIKSGHFNTLIENALQLDNGSEAFRLAQDMQSGTVKKSSANVGKLLTAYAESGGDMSFMYSPSEEQTNTDVINVEEYKGSEEVDTDLLRAAYETAEQAASDEIAGQSPDLENASQNAAQSTAVGNEYNINAPQEMRANPVATPQNAIYDVTGEEVQIDGVSSVDNGILRVTLSNGESVNVSEVTFENQDIGNLYDEAGKYDTNSAKAFVQNYDGSASVDNYARAFNTVFRGASAGVDYAQVIKNSLYAQNYLSQNARESAYAAGKNAPAPNNTTIQAQPAASEEPGVEERVEYKSDAAKSGGVKRLNTVKLTADQESYANALDVVFKAIGRTVELVDSIDLTDKSGKVVKKSSANAQFDPATNTYRIAVDSIGEAYMYFAAHESVHDIKINNPVGYEKLESIVIDFLEENGEDVSSLLQTQKDLGYDEEQAREEVVANSVPAILTDPETGHLFAERFLSEDAETRTVFEKILDSILDFMRRAYEALSKQKSWRQMRSLEQDIEAIVQIRSAYFEALKGIQANADQAVVRYSEKDSENSSIKKQLHEHQDDIHKMRPVANVEKSGRNGMTKSQQREQIAKAFKVFGYNIDRKGFGVIELDERRINDGLEYVNTDAEYAAFYAVPRVLKRGMDISGHKDHKGRGYSTYTFAAPVTINGVTGDMAVVVKKTGSYKYKMHRILSPDGSVFEFRDANTEPTTGVGKSSKENGMTPIGSASENRVPQERNTVKSSINDDTLEYSDANIRYSIREDEPPKKTKIGYKVFVAKNGKLYPPMAMKNQPTPVGVWLDADVAPTKKNADGTDKLTKTGRKQMDVGGGQTLAFRPGWHLGEFPSAPQFYETDKETGEKVQHSNFVWAECEFAADVDYQDEAMSYGNTKSGKFQHSLAGLPRIPQNGYYRYRTNPNPNTIPWFITGAMKVNRVLSDEEVRSILAENGIEAMKRAGGDIDLSKHGLDNTGTATKRFSMKDGIEETDDLIAIHNLSGEQLDGVLKLGGFPMPSIAVMRATQGHDRYGDVSVIFDKETIDPQASKSNKVYSGDAYTPNFPTVDYKPNGEVTSKISKMYYELAKKYGYDRMRPLYNFVDDDNAKDELSRNRGENGIIDRFSDDTDMMNVYLADSGKGMVDTITKEIRKELDKGTVEMLDRVIDRLGESVVDDLALKDGRPPRKQRQEWADAHADAMLEAAFGEDFRASGMEESEVKSVLESMDGTDVYNLMKQLYRYKMNGPVEVKTETDTEATQAAIRKKAADGYSEWLKALFNGIEEKRGIRNNVDFFTRSGNRRSFESLHWDITLENIVKAMKSDTSKGNAMFGGNGIFGLATNEYKSIGDIKKDISRLRAMEVEEYEAEKSTFRDRFMEIGQSVANKRTSNSFMALDNALEAICDAVRRGKTQAGIARVLKEYDSFLNISDNTAADVYSLVKDIAKMPTEYFEAKPERAVELDEVKAVIMPKDKYPGLKAQLQQHGIAVQEYSPDVDGDRVRALNSEQVKPLRFSIKDVDPVDTDAIIAENEKLKNAVELLNQQFKLTEGHHVSEKALNKLAGQLLRQTSSAYNRADLVAGLKTIFDYLSSSDTPVWDEVQSYGAGLAKKILSESRSFNADAYAEYSEMRDYLRNTTIRLTSTQASDIRYADGSLRPFIRSLFGRANISEAKGTYFDVLWHEIVNMSGGILDSDTGEGDMPYVLRDFMDSIKKERFYVNEYGYGMDEAAYDLFLQMYDAYFDIPEVKTFADKKAKELALTKAKYRNMIADMRADSKERYNARLKKLRAENVEKRREVSKKYNEILEQEKLLSCMVEGRTRMEERKQKAEELVAQKAALQERYKKLSDRKNEQLLMQRAQFRDWKTSDLAKRKERDAVQKYRSRIERTAKELHTWLTHPTDAKHVPELLRNTVSSFLQTLDFAGNADTKRAEKWRDRMRDMKDFMAKVDAADIAGGADVYMDIDSEFIERLEEFIKGSEDVRTVADLSREQLRELDYLIGIVKKAVTEANTVIIDGKRQYIGDLGSEAITNADRKGPKYTSKAASGMLGRLLNAGNIKPAYFFKNVGGSLQTLFDGIREGQNRYAFNIAKAKEFYDDSVKKHHAAAWLNLKNDTINLTTQRGDKIELTRQQALSIYATAKREAANADTNAKHLRAGGFVYEAERTEEAKGKFGQKKSYTFKDAKPKPLSDADIMKISKWLTTEQKAFADDLVQYMSTTLSALGNETSVQQTGYKKFLEGYYFPYKSSRDFLQSEPGKGQDSQRWKHKGFTKATVAGANNPVVLQDFTSVFANHVNEMLMYSAMSIPQENLLRVYNFKTPVSDEATSNSVKAAIQNAYGEAAKRYIDTFLSDLNGGVVTDPREDFASSLISRFKKGAVLASLSVAIQQPSALIRAMALVDSKYFATKVERGAYDEAKRYAGTAIIKQIGGFDTGTGNNAADWLVSTNPDTARAKIREFLAKDGTFRDNTLGWLPSKMDEITWAYIWSAVKKEIAATTNLKPGSEEFLSAAGRRFNDIIEYTQVYDSVVSRSDLMRSKSGVAKMATAFMAEPTTSYNMLYDAFVHAKDKNYKGKVPAGRALAAFVGSIVFNSVLKSVIYAMRDDDKDQTYAEKYVEALAGSIIGEPLDRVPVLGKYLYLSGDLSPISLVPYARDVLSLFQGYDVERADMSLFADLVDAIDNMDSEKKSQHEKWTGLAGAIAAMFGVPAKNVLRDIEAVFDTATQLVSGKTTMGRGVLKAMKSGVGIDGTDTLEGTYQEIASALMNGDTEYANSLQSSLMNGSSGYKAKTRREVDLGVATAIAGEPIIAQAYSYRSAANTAQLKSVYAKLRALGFNDNQITASINRYETLLNKDEDKEKEPKDLAVYDYEDLGAAIRNAAATGSYVDVDAIYEALISSSEAKDPAESIKNAVTAEFKAEYIGYVDQGDSRNADGLANVLTAQFGYTADDLTGWLLGDKSEKMRGAIDTGDAQTANEYIAQQQELGKEAASIKSSITGKYKELVLDAYFSGTSDDFQQLTSTLAALALYDSDYMPYYSWDRIWGWIQNYLENEN